MCGGEVGRGAPPAARWDSLEVEGTVEYAFQRSLPCMNLHETSNGPTPQFIGENIRPFDRGHELQKRGKRG